MTVRELVNVIGFEVDEAKMKGAEKKISKFKGSMVAVGAAIVGSILAIGVSAIKIAGDMEMLTVQFEVMLGSADKATEMMEKLKDFASSTPFSLQDLATGTQNLLSFGVAEDQVIDRMKMLGDSAGGNTEKLKGLVLAYGKTQTKGKASMEELNMFAERGIPIFKTLKEQTGLVGDEFFKAVSKGAISADDVTQAFKSMTGEGGIFFEGMIKQSKTLFGIISTLKDNVKLALAGVGTTLLEPIKEIALDLITLIQTDLSSMLESIAKALLPIIKIVMKLVPVLLGLIKPLFAIINPLLEIIANIFSLVDPLIPLFEKLGEVITQIVTPLMAILQATLKPIVEVLSTIIELLVIIANEVLGAIGDILAEVFGDMLPIFEELGALISDVLALIMPLLKPIISFMAKMIALSIRLRMMMFMVFFKIMGKGIALIIKLVRFLVAVVSKYLIPIFEKLGSVFEKVTKFINDSMMKIITGILGIINWVFEILNKTINRLNSIPGVNIDNLEPIDTAQIIAGLTPDKSAGNVNINSNINVTGAGDPAQTKRGVQDAQAIFQIELQKLLVARKV